MLVGLPSALGAPIPEPASLGLLGVGLLGMAGLRRHLMTAASYRRARAKMVLGLATGDVCADSGLIGRVQIVLGSNVSSGG